MTTVKKFLLANSIFSDLSGMILIIYSRQLSSFFSIENEWILTSIGMLLLLFSALVFLAFFIHPAKSWLVPIISALDAVWVLASIGIIATNPIGMSNQSLAAIGLVAGIIAVFAIGQFANNK